MPNAEERMKILQLLQDGKITAAQAAQLLEALESAANSQARNTAPRPAAAQVAAPASTAGRWLRVRVTDTDTGKVRVNVRMPLNLVSSGIRMGMRFAPELEGISTEDLMAFIQSGEMGQIVDVVDEDDGEHVEVYIE
jgi:hypothetical protein